MSGNNLDGHRISESLFDGLINLKTLKINHNPLRLVKKHTFSYIDVPRLARLELSHCQIRELEDGSIRQLVYLEHLDLSCNELETFHRNHLFGLTSLTTLNISHNLLVILNELPHFESLRDVYIDYNSISQMSIRDDMLLRTPLLECLSLRHNQIRLLAKDSFLWSLESLEEVYLDDNPVECDCKMQWVVDRDDFKEKKFNIP